MKNVNLRTENTGDDRVLAVDLKLKIDCTAKEVAALYQDTPDLLDTLYDESGQVLNSCFEHVYRLPVENVSLTVDDLQPWVGKVKKNVKLIPRNGQRMEVWLTVQCSGIIDCRPMAGRLHEDIKVSLFERQASLDLDDEAEAA